ncbi:MAG: OmpA family protein, partial [Betaproteobacteria bacterium]
AVKATAYVPPAPSAAPAPATTTPAGRAAARTKAPTAASSGGAQIMFATGQSSLDTSAQTTIRMAAATYMGLPTPIVITGYTNPTGNVPANVELARQRALVVRDALVQAGIRAERIRLAPPANVTGTGSNDQARRVDIVVTP